MRKTQHVYTANSHVHNALKRGERLVVNTTPYDIDEMRYSELYQHIMDFYPKSILHIGCGLGQHVTNLKKLLPNTEIVGYDDGALYKAYGEKHFDWSDIGFQTEWNFAENSFDVVFSTEILSGLSKDISHYVQKMVDVATDTVLLLEPKYSEEWLSGVKNVTKVEKDEDWDMVILTKKKSFWSLSDKLDALTQEHAQKYDPSVIIKKAN